MASTFMTLLQGVPFDEGEDPGRAPTAGDPCAEQARPFTLRRAMQNMLWMYALSLVFISFALTGLGGLDGPLLALAIVIVAAISVCYLGSAFIADAPLWARSGYVLLEIGLIASAASYSGWYFVEFGVYPSVMIAALLPWWISRWVLLVWSASLAVTSMPLADSGVLTIPLIGLCVGYSMALGVESGRRRRRLNRALDRAEQRVSTLAVAAERERIGRDLHDLLGHSLTAISVKAGLAARLAEQDPAAAKTQMTEVEEITRSALTDVRSTASGLREVRLPGEIASSKSVLLAAGIEAHTPSALPLLNDDRSQLLGYVLREAVTNVVRHSEATSCTITVDETKLVVTDNGHGPRPASPRAAGADGSGLGGIRRRVEQSGGELSVQPGEEYGTIVRADFDADDELAAATETHPAADAVAVPGPGAQQIRGSAT